MLLPTSRLHHGRRARSGARGPRGARLPSLSDVLADARAGWQAIVVPGWYEVGEHILEITSGTAVWRHGGLPVVPIGWVLVRDPENCFAPQALLCTDLDREPVQIVSWSVAVLECRGHLSGGAHSLEMETQRQWSDKAIAHTRPKPARGVLDRDTARQPSAETRTHSNDGGDMVCQTEADVRRRPCGGALRALTQTGFRVVSPSAPPTETALRHAPPLGLRSMPSRLISQSRA